MHPSVIIGCAITAVICILVTAIVTAVVTSASQKKAAASTIRNAETKAREIID